MKRFSFGQMVIMLVLVVTIASCVFSQPLYEDDYADRRPTRRQVYVDPYYGNAPMLVRDPYTGQLYEVVPVSPFGSWSSAYPYGAYPNGYGNRYYGRGYSGAPQRNQTGQPSQRSSEKIERARDIINGKQ